METNQKKLMMIMNPYSEVMKTIKKQKNSTAPETAVEFFRQIRELFWKLQPFFNVAPPLCKEVILMKNLLMKRLSFELNSKIYNFADVKKRFDSEKH